MSPSRINRRTQGNQQLYVSNRDDVREVNVTTQKLLPLKNSILNNKEYIMSIFNVKLMREKVASHIARVVIPVCSLHALAIPHGLRGVSS